MSSIKLSPNASGTGEFTIAAPNSNTNRTLTLPDASGTFLTNSGTEAGAFSTLSVNSNNISAVNSLGFRNRIINGDMRIDQRNAGASVTPTTNNTYTLDRWSAELSQVSKFSVQQNAGSVTPPSGFRNYLGITSLSAFSSAASDYFMLKQAIEGFNMADFAWGTASAQTITLSFWVRSSLTGTFGGALENNATNRCYVFSFSVSSANTWEQKTITIAGDTSGTWESGSSSGINLRFDLGSGSNWKGSAGSWSASRFFGVTGGVSVVGTNGATFYITGVQLEAGSVATPFERRDYGRELAMCQRYFENVLWFSNGYSAQWTGAAFYGVQYPFLVQKRASPSISNFTSSGYWVAPGQAVFSANGSHSFTISGVNQNAFAAQSNRPAGGSTPSQGNMYFWESSVTIPVSAEL